MLDIDLSVYLPNVECVVSNDKEVKKSFSDKNSDPDEVFYYEYPEINLEELILKNPFKCQYYTIKILTRNREDAEGCANKFNDRSQITIEYTSPNFFVLAGKYITYIDALKNLNIIKESYPNSFIVKKEDKHNMYR